MSTLLGGMREIERGEETRMEREKKEREWEREKGMQREGSFYI